MYLAVGGERPTVYRFVSPTRLEIVPKALEGILMVLFFYLRELSLTEFVFL